MDFLQTIKTYLAEQQKSVDVGVITDIDLNQDNSVLRAQVALWPEDIEIVARVTWPAIAPDAGVIMFPSVGDLVMVEFADDDEDQALITGRLSSKEDRIPVNAADGSTVIKSKLGCNVWVTGNLGKIFLSNGDSEPSENLVLGQVFKTTYESHLDKLIDLVDKLATQRTTDSTHIHTVIGIPTTTPNQAATMLAEKVLLDTLKATIQALKATDVTTEKFLSNVAYTEKGLI